MKRINITLDDQEERILKSLIKKYGGKPPAIFREALKFKYDKAFPEYGNKNYGISNLVASEELTQEQICEQIPGAKVVREDGIISCRLNDGPGIVKVAPLGSDAVNTWWKQSRKNN